MSVINPELLARLFDRHAPALALYARQWCGTPEDVVQDAFVKLARLRTRPFVTVRSTPAETTEIGAGSRLGPMEAKRGSRRTTTGSTRKKQRGC
jgi:hypothetical protein